MKKLLVFPILVLVFSFSNKENTPRTNKSYATVKNDICLKRLEFFANYSSASTLLEKKKILAEGGQYLHENLVYTIFPYWYGTIWDYNGFTDIPGEGMVACGYFVSTPLKHCGFNLNRYKLAQQASLEIVRRISCGDTVWSYRGMDSQQFIQKTKGRMKDGLYVVGLDNHTGFLLYEKARVYFIHSSYLDPGYVVREEASQSQALATSRVFVLCNISNNEKLIKKWITGEEISKRD